MIRVLAWVAVFLAAEAGTLGLGFGLLIAPVRTGTFLCDYFAVFPLPESRRARTLYRVLGATLTIFGATYGVHVVGDALRVALGRH